MADINPPDPEIPGESSLGKGNTDTFPAKRACKHWGYTLNNPTDEERDLLIQESKNRCLSWRFQREVGECGTPHFQGYMGLKKKATLKVMKTINARAHWFAAANQRDPSALKEYVQKLETCTGEWWGNFRPLTIEKPTNDWQLRIIDEIATPADLRTIHWIYDPEGGRGKTHLCKYLAVHHGALVLCGKGSDMKYAICQAVQAGNAPEVILIDLPRSVDLTYLSYSGLEEIKNGLFFSPKYEGAMCTYHNPHVYVFANKRPDMSQLSYDRWDVRDI